MAISWRIKLIVGFLVGLLIGVGGGYFAWMNFAPTSTTTTTNTIEARIGVVVPITGTMAEQGKDFNNAAALAGDDVNNFMNLSGEPWRFKLIYEDAKTTGSDALSATTTLVETQGVKTIVGYIMSAQIGACQSYLDSHKILAMCTGTSPLFSNRTQDYIWRPTGTDAMQADALAHLAILKGWNKTVVFVRDDAWGHGVNDAFVQYMSELGGQTRSLYFAPDLPDYSSGVSALSSLVASFGAQAVLYCTFGETTNIIGHALADPVLSNVGTMGTDNMQDPTFIPPMAAAAIPDFFIASGFVGTIFSNPVNPRTVAFYNEYQAKYGTRNVYPAALQLYDAVWLIALSTALAGKYDSDAIIKVLPTVGDVYTGPSGQKAFDSHGDGVIQDWAVWEFYKTTDSTYDWRDIGYFDGSARTIVMKPPPSV